MNLSKLIEEKRRAKARASKMQTAKHVATGVTLGATLGAACAVLFAPKSGKELRADMMVAAKDVNEKVKTKANTASVNCKNNYMEAKSKIKEYLDSKNKEVSDVEATEEPVSDEAVENKNIETIEEIK
ncbi:MAG: YtxH domain-containing protein [Clostridium sp.]|uniref:YtxH domain-containing protein n=1 Tax=Clostridium sp. TaxID=1506 RepID=UPI003F2ED5BE